MVSVQQAVRIIVKENPIYYAALYSGIANLSAVARSIKPMVDVIVGKDTNIMTIVKALERLERKKQNTSMDKIYDALRNAEVMVLNGVGEVTLSIPTVGRFCELLNRLVGVFKDYSIIVNDNGVLKIVAPVGALASAGFTKGGEYSLVKVTFSEKAPAGLVTFIVQLARSSGIFIRHMFRYDNSVFFIVERNDAAALLKLIEDIRSRPSIVETK